MTSHGEARKMRIGHSRSGYYPSVAWRWSLESGLRSKDSRVVRRRVVGKVPIEATRWRPILLQARFWHSGGRGDSHTHCSGIESFSPNTLTKPPSIIHHSGSLIFRESLSLSTPHVCGPPNSVAAQ